MALAGADLVAEEVGGRRALRLYQLTEAGLAVYLEWLR
jgi:DNA-binding PadR family transcriptional regulator